MPSPTDQKLALALACGGSFIAFLDATITNLAIPAMALDFGGASLATVSWVITAYAIAFAALLAPAGRLADSFGRRRLFVTGLAMFTVASAAAAAGPTMGAVIVARGVQGVGAALLLPSSLALVLASAGPQRRRAAIGLWSAAASAAAATGPTIGGVLVDFASWRALFLLNVPIGVGLLLGALRLGSDDGRPGGVPDPLGVMLLAVGVAGLVLATTQAQRWGWTSLATAGTLALALATIAVALRRSSRHPRPAIEIALWGNRTYATANIVSLLLGVALFASLFSGVLFLISLWRYSPLEAGLAMTPGAVASAVVGVTIARSARSPDPRTLVVVGSVLMAASAAVLVTWLSAAPHYITVWLPAGLLIGTGVGAASVGVSSAAALSVAPGQFAAATGLNMAARQTGGALGVAAATALIAGGDSQASAFIDVYLVCLFLGAATAIAAVRLVVPPAVQPADGPARTSTTALR